MVDVRQKGVSAFQGVSWRFICNGEGVSYRRFKNAPFRGHLKRYDTHRPNGMGAFHRVERSETP